jgi:hypothetical protein
MIGAGLAQRFMKWRIERPDFLAPVVAKVIALGDVAVIPHEPLTAIGLSSRAGMATETYRIKRLAHRALVNLFLNQGTDTRRREARQQYLQVRTSSAVSDGLRSAYLDFTVQDHAGVMEHAVNEVAIGREASIINVVDVVARESHIDLGRRFACCLAPRRSGCWGAARGGCGRQPSPTFQQSSALSLCRFLSTQFQMLARPCRTARHGDDDCCRCHDAGHQAR